jgi:hypothetical protein
LFDCFQKGDAAMQQTKPRHVESWIEYFQEKERRQYSFDAVSTPLSDEEKQRITHSIQQFELGENAEGRNFLAAAERYAEQSGDSEYPLALQLFIREEQRHSRFLREFMIEEDIPRLEKHWVDSWFRKIRKLAGLEIFITVLVTAEIIATPYYRSLLRATGNRRLRSICRQILKDEVRHIHFQAETLAKLRAAQSSLRIRLTEAAHAGFMLGTAFVVWREHKAVLRSAGYTWSTFTRACLRGLAKFDALAAPRGFKTPVRTRSRAAARTSFRTNIQKGARRLATSRPRRGIV